MSNISGASYFMCIFIVQILWPVKCFQGHIDKFLSESCVSILKSKNPVSFEVNFKKFDFKIIKKKEWKIKIYSIKNKRRGKENINKIKIKDQFYLLVELKPLRNVDLLIFSVSPWALVNVSLLIPSPQNWWLPFSIVVETRQERLQLYFYEKVDGRVRVKCYNCFLFFTW